MSKEPDPKVEKAKIADVPHIHRLVNSFAEKGEMLPRSLSEIYENVRDYFVIRSGEKILACVAFHINWEGLAEVRSLVVSENHQNQGLGRILVEACLGEAHELGIRTVFCLTYKPAFFEKMGFEKMDVMELPRKVWGECFRCPKFPNCDEVALVRTLDVINK